MKAILVIDMPQNCLDCPCSFTFGSPPQNICEAMNDTSLTKENMNNTKPSWCPLRLLPEKKDLNAEEQIYLRRDYDKVYKVGWNERIDEILGETE